jgi:hypothetical protein
MLLRLLFGIALKGKNPPAYVASPYQEQEDCGNWELEI